ncbi:MAG TPA: diguanylate cyclase, partial [Candidatus Baltobacteraceae bacterium]|nr:diguanylate cyclase [Candidatus Baltobacteraceae bacterium]
MQRKASLVAICALFLVVAAATVVTMLAQPIPYGWLGLTVESRHPGWKRAPLTVASVEPGSVAARSGLLPGDRIVGSLALADRIALALEAPQGWLAAQRPVSFSVQHGTQPARPIRLRGSTRSFGPLWFVLMRLSMYLLGVAVVCALVALRPSPVTWSFALYVVLFLWPNFWYWQYAGVYASPVALFATILVSYALISVGSLALVVFATRFPESTPHPRIYRTVERIAIGFFLVVGAAFVQFQAAQVYGWPTIDYNMLSNAQEFVPALVAIALLGWTLARSRKEERGRLAWAIAGPLLCALFQVVDTWLKSIPTLPIVYPTTAGFISSIAPFAMMYAILRYKVIDIGFTLNRSLAQAVSQPKSAARDAREARRSIVRRAALLFSADLPLHELYGQLAALLGSFVNAQSVLVAVRDEGGAHLEYAYEDGAGGRPDDDAIPPDSAMAQVLRDGAARLLGRTANDPQSGIFVPVEFGGAVVGVLGVQSPAPGAYDDEDLALLKACALYLGARMKNDVGVAARAGFDDAMAREWKQAAALRESLGVLLVDVDLFAGFNESYGHVAGDTALRQIAAALAAALVEADARVARYGGDRFAIALYGAGDAQTKRYARDAEAAVRALHIPHQGSSLGCVTVSIGAASSVPLRGADWRVLVAEADGDLARARRDRAARRVIVARHNLPGERSTFVGRFAEVRAVEDALGACRLVTVAGPGGVGKTRVALEVARRALERYPDGVWFVDLASLKDGDAVVQAVAAALGFDSAESASAHLAERLSAKHLLLILDHCEHLVDACAALAKGLLGGTRDVRILATTREPFAIAGERVLRLPPLSTGDALELFFDRTGREAATEDRTAAEGIVTKLDGLPMAIELAAARGTTLAPAALLATLSESLPGLQTLRALFEWSYQLLTPAEQAVLRRLSVFSGGWSLDAAVALCSDGSVSSAAVYDAMESLSAKSLVLREERDGIARFRFLETTRQYAYQALERCGEDRSTILRHLQWATAAAWEMKRRKSEMAYGDWLELQTAEFGNYAAALREALGKLDDDGAAATILRSLSGLLGETQAFAEFYEGLRSRVQSETLPDAQAAAFWLALAQMTHSRDPRESLEAARNAADLFRRCGDGLGEAYAVWSFAGAQARVFGAIGQPTQPRIESALVAARASGDRHLIVGLLRKLARVNGENGRSEQARATLWEAAEIVDHSDTVMLTAVIGGSADEELRGGNIDAAI